VNTYLREIAFRFAQEIVEYDRGKARKNRAQLREAMIQYMNQEVSDYIDTYLKSDSGESLLDGVQRRYEKPIPYLGVRYGASGEYSKSGGVR
jgi:hypothetical protein